jgi:molybdopterin molybdotransferase
MKPRANLLEFEIARRQLLDFAAAPTAHATVGLLQAQGRVLAQTVTSPINVPGFDNSAMDGYALHVTDIASEASSFAVVQRIAAGQTGVALAPNTAARIFTGAPIPEGCNVVVPQEHTTESNGSIFLTQQVNLHQHIRRKGEDITKDDTVLVCGQRMGPAQLAMLASIGVAAVNVFRQLKVGVFFTGDELTEPGQPLAPGAIYNSNRYAINGLLKQLGCEVSDYGIVRDSAQATRDALQQAASENDIVMTCGGVSVGEEDHVKAAVIALGQLDLWQISMKPGKPLAYGKVGQADFIGLPGNPVSAFVTFLLMARPFLLKRMGATDTALRYLTAEAAFNWPRPDRRREFLRAKLERNALGQDTLQLWPNQGSGVMSSLAWADGLVDLPAETQIKVGDKVQYLSISDLLNF